MAPTHTLDFRPTNTNDKKVALLSAISFLESKSIPYKRGDLYKYIDVHERTAQKWVVAASNPASNNGTKEEDLKPLKSEDTVTANATGQKPSAPSHTYTNAVKAQPHKPTAPSRPGTTGRSNAAQTSKKRKMKHEEDNTTPQPSTPKQLLTPPSRQSTQPRKKLQTTESLFDLGMENSDEYAGV